MSPRFVVAFTVLVGLFAQASSPAALEDAQEEQRYGAQCQGGCGGILPAGFNGFLVFMATGAIPLADGFFLDGAIFQERIMKRTPAQIAQNRAAALAWFQTRFGIVNADTHPDVDFFGFYVDPRINYRAYVISGRHVPEEGMAAIYRGSGDDVEWGP